MLSADGPPADFSLCDRDHLWAGSWSGWTITIIQAATTRVYIAAAQAQKVVRAFATQV